MNSRGGKRDSDGPLRRQQRRATLLGTVTASSEAPGHRRARGGDVGLTLSLSLLLLAQPSLCLHRCLLPPASHRQVAAVPPRRPAAPSVPPALPSLPSFFTAPSVPEHHFPEATSETSPGLFPFSSHPSWFPCSLGVTGGKAVRAKKSNSYCWLSFYLKMIDIPMYIHKTFQDPETRKQR